MKNIRLLTTIVLLMLVGRTYADNLSVPNISLAAGESKGLEIELVNPTKLYTAFQFDMVLPEGVSIAKNSRGKYYATLSSRKYDDHTITVDLVEGNTYRFISYSNSNETFEGNSGTLLTVPLVAAADATGGAKVATITKQTFTDPDGIQSKWDDVNFNITLPEPSITVTAKSYSRGYGEDNPAFGYDVEGGTLTGEPAISCEATSSSPVGTYAIVISQGTVTNGNVTFVNGTLTINQKEAALSWGNTELTYSGQEQKPTATVSNLVGSDECTVTVSGATDAGSHTSTATALSNSNYKLPEANTQTFTIKKAALTASAGNYTKKYGEALPTFTATYEGFKNNETENVLTTKPTLTTTATSSSNVGNYDVNISGGEAKNYEFSYVKGTLTISKADLSVTADAKTKEYGAKDPELTYKSVGLIGTDAFTGALTRTAGEDVGEYDITQGTLTAGDNYNIAYTGAKLTITVASLPGVSATGFEGAYDGAAHTITVTAPTGSTIKYGTTEGTYDLDNAPAYKNVGNYTVYYKAFNSNQMTTGSQVVSITQKEAALSWGNTELTYSGQEQKPTATVSNLVGSDECTVTVSGATDAGSHTSTATALSNSNYKLPEANTQTFTIKKAALTITAKSYTMKRGDALPSFDAEYSGFKNNETKAVLTTQPTFTTSATSDSELGTYDIIVSGASATNYDITYVKGTLTITQADPVTVNAKSCSREYGEANPSFEYTTSGATLKGTPSLSCEATATSPVGEYDIVVSKGSVTNYNVNFVNGKLTVTKAPLTITAKSYTIMQGNAMPSFEVEYDGFKNGETSSVLSTQPVITTTATDSKTPGTYEIIVASASATNYDVSFVNGVLIIEPINIDPVDETETTTFSEEVNENTDLSNTVIDNTYYTVNTENGDGYDATEQAIVLNSTTTAEQMNTVQNAEVGDATMQENYNGIIFELPAGNGTITVEAKTIGSHVLNVQIGNAEPNKITKSERGTADVPYNVATPTYVYLYASTSGASGAPKRAAAANSVLLYSYKVTVTVNGISVVTYDDLENAKWYTMDGLQLQGKPTKKGLYIVNGRKVVVK